MYYRLGADRAQMNVYLELESDLMISLIRGSLLPDDLPVPFRYTMRVDADAEGVPQQPRMFSFFPSRSVMEARLVETLQAAGVDNLQLFPAVLRHPEAGSEYTNYFTVNVVGLVSCANVGESTAEPLADVYYFHDLVIDPAKTRDLLLFRLAESPMEIIVHERVARAIQEGGFTGIVLEKLEEA